MEYKRIVNQFFKFNDKKSVRKDKIVFMNFFYSDVNLYAENIDKKKLPHFLIYKDGRIIKLKDSLSIAACMGVNDEFNIYVGFENEGLVHGTISSYNTEIMNTPFHKKWKGHSLFYDYTDEQYDAANYLLKILFDKHTNIEKKVVSNNIDKTKDGYSGVCGRSNIIDSYYDMTPSFLWNNISV